MKEITQANTNFKRRIRLYIALPNNTNLAILTIPAVADGLKLTAPRVLQLIRDRQLKAWRLGRIWVLEKDLHSFVERKREEFAKRYGSILMPPEA